MTAIFRAYDIGTANTWTGAASWIPAGGLGSANANNSIAPIAEGFWTGQFRGSGAGNTAANPYFHFFSTERNGVTFHTAMANYIGWMDGSSAHGALAVFEPEGLIAFSYNGGVAVFQYEFERGSNGVPTVRMLFQDNLGGLATTYEDFEFDFAGNLYAVSASGQRLSKWAMPTGNNEQITPARTSLFIGRGGIVIREYEVSICEGETFSNDYFSNLNTTGTHEYIYTHTGNTITVRVILTVHPNELYEMSETINEGTTFTNSYFNIVEATMADSRTHEFVTVTSFGCERIVRLHLTVVPLTIREYTEAICEGETFSNNYFENLNVAGVHERHFEDGNMLIRLTLTIHPNEVYEISATINESETFSNDYFNIVGATLEDSKTHIYTTYTAHGCERIVKLHLTVLPGVGLGEVSLENAVRIFPNPVRTELHIATDLTINRLEIVDISGNLVQLFNYSTHQVDVSSLPQGIYFIRIETDRGTVTKRFVKE